MKNAMTVSITANFDCTQRELVIDIAKQIYRLTGCKSPENPEYFWGTQHPTAIDVRVIAEELFEMFAGDSPSYDDEDEEVTARFDKAWDSAQ